MEIALIQDNAIVSIGDYRIVFSNTSFTSDGPTDEFLLANNAKRVNLYKDYDSLTECLETVEPYIEGDWVYRVSVRALTDEEVQTRKDSAMQQIRATRNQLLATSDWTQLVDTPEAIKSAWVTYRQALRDLPSTITEPRTFSAWPTKS
jgi:Phage tail assembly chaperone protein